MPDIYSQVFGPYIDETFFNGVHTLAAVFQKYRTCEYSKRTTTTNTITKYPIISNEDLHKPVIVKSSRPKICKCNVQSQTSSCLIERELRNHPELKAIHTQTPCVIEPEKSKFVSVCVQTDERKKKTESHPMKSNKSCKCPHKYNVGPVYRCPSSTDSHSEDCYCCNVALQTITPTKKSRQVSIHSYGSEEEGCLSSPVTSDERNIIVQKIIDLHDGSSCSCSRVSSSFVKSIPCNGKCGIMRSNPEEIRYAITKISKFKNFSTYEIMKSTTKTPKSIPKYVEGIFVLKQK